MAEARPFTIVGSSRDRDAWLELRRGGISASDAPGVMGVGWRSPAEVWASKVGVPGEAEEQSEWVWWGLHLEAPIAEAYASDRYAGRDVELAGNLLRSTRLPWATCTLDAWTFIDGVRCPLEIKTTSAYRADAWADGPPETYVWQLQHQMMVTETPVASIACLIGGQDFVWCDIERDERAIQRLARRCEALWARIQTGEMPEDFSEGGERVLRRLHPEANGREVGLPHELLEVDDDFVQAGEDEKDAKRRKQEARTRIMRAIGSFERGVLPNGVTYTLKNTKRGRSLRRKEPKEWAA